MTNQIDVGRAGSLLPRLAVGRDSFSLVSAPLWNKQMDTRTRMRTRRDTQHYIDRTLFFRGLSVDRHIRSSVSR
ncbi:hypothetical protein LCGC14_0916490 [marine sediment metagenome]|uniref:Uncharacterized protein n=1 Tax=marine sediment metagenome TaxID=412755 RepID=A0A0F9NWX6_9ZZZZ